MFVSVSVLCDVTIERESDLFKFTESQSGFPQNQIDSLLPLSVSMLSQLTARITHGPRLISFSNAYQCIRQPTVL